MPERTVDGGGLPCPKCGSPLVPCRCQREAARPRVRGWNTTLRTDPRKRMRAKTLQEKFGDDQLRYGPLWELVRRRPCFGKSYLPGHVCALGYAPPSAHHLGKTDLDGLLPVDGALHDEVELYPETVAKALQRAASPTLHILADQYVDAAVAELREAGELPPEVEQAWTEKRAE